MLFSRQYEAVTYGETSSVDLRRTRRGEDGRRYQTSSGGLGDRDGLLPFFEQRGHVLCCLFQRWGWEDVGRHGPSKAG